MSNRDGPVGAVENGHLGVDAEALIDGGANVGLQHGTIFDVGGCCSIAGRSRTGFAARSAGAAM